MPDRERKRVPGDSSGVLKGYFLHGPPAHLQNTEIPSSQTSLWFTQFANKSSLWLTQFADKSSLWLTQFAEKSSLWLTQFAEKSSLWLTQFAEEKKAACG